MFGKPQIFRDNPISSNVALSTGEAPAPYLVEDGEALLIFGTVDRDILAAALGYEDVHPVLRTDKRVAAGFIVADFRKASMGPHSELQFFLLVSPNAGEFIEDTPFALPLAMASRPELGTLCMHLWNDDASVIAYNNEYLGLNAAEATFDLFRQDGEGRLAFAVAETSGAPVLSGKLEPSRSTSFGIMRSMAGIVGWRRLLALGFAPYSMGYVINRKSAVMPDNRRAQIFTAARHNVMRAWDSSSDKLTVANPNLALLDFRPDCVQRLWPFQFAYRHPDDRV